MKEESGEKVKFDDLEEMTSDYEALQFLDRLSIIMKQLFNLKKVNNFEYFLLFLFRDQFTFGTDSDIKAFANLFFDTLEGTICFEDATIIDETYVYNILNLTQTFLSKGLK